MRAAVAAAALAVAAPAAAQPVASVYTATTERACRVTSSNVEEAWSVSRCPGPNGWALDVSDSDLRASIDVVAPGRRATPLRFSEVVTGAFSTLGERAEWRVRGRGPAARPYALIVRLNASEIADAPERPTSYLVVADLRQGCVVARVPPGPGQNEQARRAADRPGPCLPPLS